MFGHRSGSSNAGTRLSKATWPVARSIASHCTARIEKLDSRVLLSAGALDPGFGGSGLVTQDFGFGDDFGYAVTVQSDGRILVAGTVRSSNAPTTSALPASTPTARSIRSFGTGRRVITDFATSGRRPTTPASIVVDSSGRIYVAGFTNRGSRQRLCRRTLQRQRFA
jgi:hypothetical protein